MIALPAFLGLVLCLFNDAGANIFCLTTGCSLYAGYSLFGLSFYAYGALGFGVILLLAAGIGKIPRAAPLLGWVILVGLVLDLLFLAWQILFWPCSSCLIVALLLGWAAVSFRLNHARCCRPLFMGVLLVWAILLIPVTVAVGKEIFLVPWAIHGPSEATVRVFFSPSCPACSSEIDKLLQSPEADHMAFFPIAKNERDLRMVAEALASGTNSREMLSKIFQAGAVGSADPVGLNLRWRLAKNKMILAGHGAQTVPFILTPTVIGPPQPTFNNLFSAPDFHEDTHAEGCGAFGWQESSPCD